MYPVIHNTSNTSLGYNQHPSWVQAVVLFRTFALSVEAKRFMMTTTYSRHQPMMQAIAFGKNKYSFLLEQQLAFKQPLVKFCPESGPTFFILLKQLRVPLSKSSLLKIQRLPSSAAMVSATARVGLATPPIVFMISFFLQIRRSRCDGHSVQIHERPNFALELTRGPFVGTRRSQPHGVTLAASRSLRGTRHSRQPACRRGGRGGVPARSSATGVSPTAQESSL